METIKLQDGKTAEELKEIYNNNKQELKHINYYKDEIKTNFVLLEQDKEILISDYPYGYLRTYIKYSIETTNRGGRFCAQTQNPKTKVWNKTKKSTYKAIKLLIINEDGHIKTLSLDYNDSISKIKEFEKLFLKNLNDLQKKELAKIKAYNKVMENVTFKISAKPIDTKKHEQEQKETSDLINRAVNIEAIKNYKEFKEV